jgi:hypothetical protein
MEACASDSRHVPRRHQATDACLAAPRGLEEPTARPVLIVAARVR